MFIRNIQFNDWYEEYIVDTVSKNLLRVRFYRSQIDTLLAGHPDPITGKWPIVINDFVQSYTFYYKENQLIKICDNIGHADYYTMDKDFITNDKNSWRTIGELDRDYVYFKAFWFYNNRFVKHFLHLF